MFLTCECIEFKNLVECHQSVPLEHVTRSGFEREFNSYSLLLKLSCGTSVQAQAAAYFKSTNIQKNSQKSYISVEVKSSGSTLFRDGIKRRHRRQLDEYRHLKLDGTADGDTQNILVGHSANIIPFPAYFHHLITIDSAGMIFL